MALTDEGSGNGFYMPVAPAYGYGGNGGGFGFGGGDWAWILLLLLIGGNGWGFGGGFGGALIEAADISQASDEEVVRIAQEKGIDLGKYEVR